MKPKNIKKIQNLEDVKTVSQMIMRRLVVEKNLCYFNIVVGEVGGFSQCFFTPTTQIHEGKETRYKPKMIFVGDYDKLMMLLMSHPNISDLEYDVEENMITACFNNRLAEEWFNQDVEHI